jgi:hypothetical protein
MTFRSSEPRKLRRFWGLRMADSTLKERLIEAGTQMEEAAFRLLETDEKSPIKY